MVSSSRHPAILQVLPALKAGGVERGTLEMAEAVIAAGGRAIVASAGGPLVDSLERIGAEHVTIDLAGKSPLAIWRNGRRLSGLIARENIDLVHARSRAPAWAASRACRAASLPFVTTWHGLHNANWAGKRHYNAILARGDRVIATSAFIAERLSQDYHVPPERLRLIPRGADVARFDPTRVTGQRIQTLVDAWAIPEGARTIMLPGRLTRWKGHMVTIEALSLLASTLPQPWACIFVGPADPEDRYVRELCALAARRGIAANLRFAGHCQDMAAAYALADVVVAPSLRPEPFGRIAVEAQAMGRPVIATAIGGSVETILPDRTGLLIPANDAPALAEAVLGVLSTPPDALALLAETARDHVLARYRTSDMQTATLRVYDELLGTQLSPTFQAMTEALPA
ncbi:glycosyltransferase family 4 protein [Brytella acorum]|uniref:Glycosyltransferase family 4 protein n=1 Tax=Brytella acorum TaxID=2959299 RepID=A0AA35VCL3_9PROT|nr:glycosyltransferase family 4 protein [Brytella acorum]MDF3624013.1 glycosyltransferase family 4 protein [Brytella acorum]CAI9120884.1 glycosyltransferase family 4 protein [Brytella acorum]